MDCRLLRVLCGTLANADHFTAGAMVASFRVGSATDYLASVGFVAGDEVATYDERSSRSSLHQLGMIGLGELEQAVGQRPGGRLKFRVRKNRDPPCAWHRLFQQFEPLRHEFDGEYPRNPAGHEVVDELGMPTCGLRGAQSEEPRHRLDRLHSGRGGLDIEWIRYSVNWCPGGRGRSATSAPG